MLVSPRSGANSPLILLLYLLPSAFLDDYFSCGGRETRDLDFRHHYTRETREVLAKLDQSNLGKRKEMGFVLDLLRL